MAHGLQMTQPDQNLTQGKRMTETKTNDLATAQSHHRFELVRDFAASDLFDRTFKEGMGLVEETAAYLDGEGRRDSRLLSREDALSYAGESMRLTTRLMQIASWLLVQRAVREGDMEPKEACDDKYRLAEVAAKSAQDTLTIMPTGLLSLLDRANRLYERVAHLDRRMFIEAQSGPEAVNPVLDQMAMLKDAFGQS